MGEDELWVQLVELLRAYAVSRFGLDILAVTFHLTHQQKAKLPVPHMLPLPAGMGDEPAPWHSEDYRRVRWPGAWEGTLSRTQAAVVRQLWEVADELPQEQLLRGAGSDGTRLHDLFRRSDAWGRLIVPGEVAGTFTLPWGAPERESGAG